MLKYAQYFAQELSSHLPTDFDAENIVNFTGSTDRYVLYKVGPVLTASVGPAAVTAVMNWIETILRHWFVWAVIAIECGFLAFRLKNQNYGYGSLNGLWENYFYAKLHHPLKCISRVCLHSHCTFHYIQLRRVWWIGHNAQTP